MIVLHLHFKPTRKNSDHIRLFLKPEIKLWLTQGIHIRCSITFFTELSGTITMAQPNYDTTFWKKNPSSCLYVCTKINKYSSQTILTHYMVLDVHNYKKPITSNSPFTPWYLFEICSSSNLCPLTILGSMLFLTSARPLSAVLFDFAGRGGGRCMFTRELGCNGTRGGYAGLTMLFILLLYTSGCVNMLVEE